MTGFGPFPRVPRNPSGLLAERVAASPRWRLQGWEARSLVLPTTYAAIDAVLHPALERERPDVLLMLGVAARRRALCIETRAVNRVSSLFPDAGGVIRTRLAFAPGAPHLLHTRVPLPGLLRALRST